jgi:hypothetical protein
VIVALSFVALDFAGFVVDVYRDGLSGLGCGITSIGARFWDSKVVDEAGSLDTKTAGGKHLPDGADVDSTVSVLISLNPSITRVSHWMECKYPIKPNGRLLRTGGVAGLEEKGYRKGQHKMSIRNQKADRRRNS